MKTEFSSGNSNLVSDDSQTPSESLIRKFGAGEGVQRSPYSQPLLLAQAANPLMQQVLTLPVSPPTVWQAQPLPLALTQTLPITYQKIWVTPQLLNPASLGVATQLSLPLQQRLGTFAASTEVTALPLIQRTQVLNRALYASLLHQSNPQEFSARHLSDTFKRLPLSTVDTPTEALTPSLQPKANSLSAQPRVTTFVDAVRGGGYASTEELRDTALAYAQQLPLANADRQGLAAEINGQFEQRQQLQALSVEETRWQSWVDRNLTGSQAGNTNIIANINQMMAIKRELITLVSLERMVEQGLPESRLPKIEGAQLTRTLLNSRITELRESLGAVDQSVQTLSRQVGQGRPDAQTVSPGNTPNTSTATPTARSIGLPPDSQIAALVDRSPGSALAGVLRDDAQLTQSIIKLNQAGWSFDWVNGVKEARVLPEQKQVALNAGLAQEDAWPLAVNLALRDAVAKANLVESGVENSVSWLSVPRGPLDQAVLQTTMRAEFGARSANRPLYETPAQRVLTETVRQAWREANAENPNAQSPNIRLYKTSDTTSTLRGTDNASIPNYRAEVSDSAGTVVATYELQATSIRDANDNSGNSVIDWRASPVPQSQFEDGSTTTVYARANPATPSASPFARESIPFESNLTAEQMRTVVMDGLKDSFPLRSDALDGAILEPLPGNSEHHVPASTAFQPGQSTTGINSSRPDNRSTVDIPHVSWRLSVLDAGLRHDYLVRVTGYDHSDGRIALEVSADPASSRRANQPTPRSGGVGPSTLATSQVDIAESSIFTAEQYQELVSDLRSLDPTVALQLLQRGHLDDISAQTALNVKPFVLYEGPLADAVRELSQDRRTLVLYTTNSQADLTVFQNHPSITLERVSGRNTVDALSSILGRQDLREFDRVIAVGGGGVKDLAGTVFAKGKDQLKPGADYISVPTQLAQTGIGTKFAIQKPDTVVTTPLPEQTVVVLPKVLGDNPQRVRATMLAGMADYSAGLSYAATIAARDNIPIDVAIARYAGEAANVYRWFADNTPAIGEPLDHESATVLAYAFQEYSLQNMPLIADEHNLFDVFSKLRPDDRSPSHGEWVAVGTLLNTYVYGERTGDFSLYQQIRDEYLRVGIPATLDSLAEMGVSRENLIHGLGILRNSESPRPALLRDYLKTNDPGQLLEGALGSR